MLKSRTIFRKGINMIKSKIMLALLASLGLATSSFAASTASAPVSASAPTASKLPKVSGMPVSVDRTDLVQAMPNAVLFNLGESKMSTQFMPILQWNVTYLNKFSGAKIKISGNADDYKNAAQNMTLSMQRAQNVRFALMDMGVQDQQIEVVALGDREQKFKKDSDGHQPRNQRVDVFYTTQKPKGYTVEKIPVVTIDTFEQTVIPEAI